jgi:hypothetical protein
MRIEHMAVHQPYAGKEFYMQVCSAHMPVILPWNQSNNTYYIALIWMFRVTTLVLTPARPSSSLVATTATQLWASIPGPTLP